MESALYWYPLQRVKALLIASPLKCFVANECSGRGRRSEARSTFVGSGQESVSARPGPIVEGRNAREQDETRTGQDGPHFGTWMGPKRWKTKHMANVEGTPSDPGWDLDGTPGEGLDGSPRDSKRPLGLSEFVLLVPNAPDLSCPALPLQTPISVSHRKQQKGVHENMPNHVEKVSAMSRKCPTLSQHWPKAPKNVLIQGEAAHPNLDGEILANRFQGFWTEPFFCESKHSRESLARYENRGFPANRFARVDLRESPRFALRIAGPSKHLKPPSQIRVCTNDWLRLFLPVSSFANAYRGELLCKLFQTLFVQTVFFFRAARLRNRTAPDKNLIWHEKRFEKREKGPAKTIQNVTEKLLAPLRPPKHFSPALF